MTWHWCSHVLNLIRIQYGSRLSSGSPKFDSPWLKMQLFQLIGFLMGHRFWKCFHLAALIRALRRAYLPTHSHSAEHFARAKKHQCHCDRHHWRRGRCVFNAGFACVSMSLCVCAEWKKSTRKACRITWNSQLHPLTDFPARTRKSYIWIITGRKSVIQRICERKQLRKEKNGERERERMISKTKVGRECWSSRGDYFGALYNNNNTSADVLHLFRQINHHFG